MFCLCSWMYTICMLGACQGQKASNLPGSGVKDGCEHSCERWEELTLLISCKSNKCSELRHLSITTLPHQPRNSPLCKKFTNKQTKTKGPHYYQVQLFPRWVAHAFNASVEKQKQVDLLVPSLVYIARSRTDGAT